MQHHGRPARNPRKLEIVCMRYAIRQNLRIMLISVLCLLPGLLPVIAHWIHVPESHLVVPVNSPLSGSSDDSYYAAFTTEASRGTFPMENPFVASDETMNDNIELFKSVNHWFSAWPAIFIEDPRLVIFVAQYSGALLIFFLVYKVLLELRVGRNGAIATALFLFYAQAGIFNNLFNNLINVLFRGYGFRLLWGTIVRHLNSSPYALPSYTNSNFRYLICSSSNIILMLFLFCAIKLLRGQRISFALPGLAISSFLIVYTYLPSAIFLVVLALLPPILLAFNRRRSAMHVLVAGLLTASLLLISGFPMNYLAISRSSYGVQELLRTNSWLYQTSQMHVDNQNHYFNYYAYPTLFFLLLLLPLWRLQRKVYPLCLATGAALLLMMAVTYQREIVYVMLKTFSRGIELPWTVLVVGCVLGALRRLVLYLLHTRARRATWRFGLRIASVFFVLAAVSFATFGMGRLALDASRGKNSPYYLEREIWTTYTWLRTNTPAGSIVLSHDWGDLNLLPVYTHNRIYYGNWQNNARPLAAEITGYIAAAKLLGEPRSTFAETVENSLVARRDYLQKNQLFLTGELERIPEEISRQGLFLPTLFYWPYVYYYEGDPISAPSEVGLYASLTVSDLFLREMLALYDGMDTFPEHGRPQYLLLTPAHFTRMDAIVSSGGRLLFQNSLRRVIELPPDFSFSFQAD